MEDGDDEVESHQHIQIPQRSGVIVEIEMNVQIFVIVISRVKADMSMVGLSVVVM